MVRVCAVYGCNARVHPGTSFHRFPLDPITSSKWLDLCGNERLLRKSEQQLSSSHRVCTKHFSSEDKYRNSAGAYVFCRPNVLPTLCLPKPLSELGLPAMHTLSFKDDFDADKSDCNRTSKYSCSTPLLHKSGVTDVDEWSESLERNKTTEPEPDVIPQSSGIMKSQKNSQRALNFESPVSESVVSALDDDDEDQYEWELRDYDHISREIDITFEQESFIEGNQVNNESSSQIGKVTFNCHFGWVEEGSSLFR